MEVESRLKRQALADKSPKGCGNQQPEFPRRNAKTRWDEPAGLFASSHLAVAVLVVARWWFPFPSGSIAEMAGR